MNFCPNCGNIDINKYGIDENGGIYKFNKCKGQFSIKIYKDGNYYILNKDKS